MANERPPLRNAPEMLRLGSVLGAAVPELRSSRGGTGFAPPPPSLLWAPW